MLHELQRDFRRAMLDGDKDAVVPRVVSDRIPADGRLDVYRGNTIMSLTHVLAEAFPVCRRVTGEDNFKVLAREFVTSHPPNRPYLYSYGDQFPDFLEGFAPAMRDHPFIADLARLEWAYADAYFAADAPPLSPEAIQSVPQEQYPALRFSLHPATRLVRSGFDILPLWTGEREPEAHRHDRPERAQFILLSRPDLDIRHAALSAGDFAMVTALGAGEPLETAAARAEASEPGFDLMRALIAHLARGTFCGVSA